MTCEEVKALLTDYLDKSLDTPTTTRVAPNSRGPPDAWVLCIATHMRAGNKTRVCQHALLCIRLITEGSGLAAVALRQQLWIDVTE